MKRRRFRHLTWTDRLKIEAMLKAGRHKQEIADEIGVHLRTIYNEIKRGRYMHTMTDLTEEERYSPDIAEAAYRENLAAKGPDLKIGRDHKLAQHIEKKIGEEGYSPAAVLGEIKEQKIEFDTTICESTLYSYIDKGVFLTITNKDLPAKCKKKRSYKRVRKAARPPAGASIENRPKEVNSRDTFGHWEMDCLEGKKKSKKPLLVLTERKSRKEIIIPMRDQTSRSVIAAIDRLERQHGADFYKIFRTITVDNGSEFSDCKGIEKSCRRKGRRTKLYYCHPYSSCERGSNENQNRMIRRWFPKGTDFSQVTAKTIRWVEDWLNNYPRETHGFRSANSVFEEGVALLI